MNPFHIQTAEYGKFAKLPVAPKYFPAFGNDPYAVMTQDVGIPLNHLIALRQLSGCFIIDKYGKNADVDTSTDPEDIWAGGGLYTGFTTVSAVVISLSSTSLVDNGAGAGARTILIEGLDENWNIQTEVISLSGTTPSISTKLWWRCNLATVLTAGVSSQNVGDIDIYDRANHSIKFSSVAATIGRSHTAAWTSPAGYVCILSQIFSFVRGSAATTNANMSIVVRPYGGAWLTRLGFIVSLGSNFNFNYLGGIILTEKTDVVLRCEVVDQNNTEIAGGFSITAYDKVLYQL